MTATRPSAIRHASSVIRQGYSVNSKRIQNAGQLFLELMLPSFTYGRNNKLGGEDQQHCHEFVYCGRAISHLLLPIVCKQLWSYACNCPRLQKDVAPGNEFNLISCLPLKRILEHPKALTVEHACKSFLSQLSSPN